MSPPNPDQTPFIASSPVSTAASIPLRVHWPLQATVALLLLIPWLMPFAGIPSPPVWQGLTSVLCVGFLLAILASAGAGVLTPAVIGHGWTIAAALSALIGAIQYFGFSDAFIPWINQTRPGEAFGNLRQRNQFASLMGIGLAALIWQHRGSYGKYAPFLLVLFALGNAASGSRTGSLQWLAILLMGFAFGSRGLRGTKRTALLAFAAYLFWALVLPWMLLALTGALSGGLAARFAETPGCASRMVLWTNVLTLIAQRPWFGWGWGELDYAHYVMLYPGERFCDILDNAHNLPLHLAVELGIPLALIVCGVLTWLVMRARPWREAYPSRQMAWAVLALIGLHSLLEYPLWYGPFQIAVGLCVYVLWTTRPERDTAVNCGQGLRAHAGAFARPRMYRYLLAFAAALTVTAVTYATWDYHRVSQIYLTPSQRDPAYRENTLEKISDTVLFRPQFEFAALSLTPLTSANALEIHALATGLLHYSPEPRVIEKVIESAVMLRRDDEAMWHLARYRAAFPQQHAKWRHGFMAAEGGAR